MSTFPGLFDQFPWISADRFDNENLNSKVFFLSHCHGDHMVGLDNSDGLPGPLYTSAVSKVLVKKQFPHLKEIRVLEIESPEQITLVAAGQEVRLTVTALPARHCPGSIMLLIESQQFRVLYTGDFRLAKKDLKDKFLCLCSTGLDAVYLDSSFLNKTYQEFPSQTQSIKALCGLITEWTSKSKNHKIIMEIPAQYGSEFIFMEIRRKLKLKSYVHDRQYQKYAFFPDMDKCISNDPSVCQILIVQKLFERTKTLQSFNALPSAVYRTIRISALFWKFWKHGDPIVLKEKNETYRVAYSSHSSCTELEDFIEFVKPKSVNLNVLPKSAIKATDMKNRVRTILDKFLTKDDEKDEIPRSKIKFDNLFRIPNRRESESDEIPLRMPIKRVKM